MKLRVGVLVPNFADAIKKSVAKKFTDVVKRETRALEKEFEGATVSAGLGRRMSLTWTSKVYPEGKDSLAAAGLVWSKAPQAMRAFAEGATIRAFGGKQFLAIPTEAGLRLMGGKRGSPPDALARLRTAKVGRGAKQRMVIDRGIELEVVPLRRGGKAQAAIVTRGATIGRSGVARSATRRRAAQGMLERPIVLFWLVRSVVIRKRLDLETMAAGAISRIRAGLAEAVAAADREMGAR